MIFTEYCGGEKIQSLLSFFAKIRSSLLSLAPEQEQKNGLLGRIESLGQDKISSCNSVVDEDYNCCTHKNVIALAFHSAYGMIIVE